MNSIQLIPIKASKILEWGDSVFDNLIQSLEDQNLTLADSDLLCISSKLFSVQHQRGVELSLVIPSKEAISLAETSRLSPEFAQKVLEESDYVLGTSYQSILTETKFGLYSNAGIDLSNSPNDSAILLPLDPDKDAERIRLQIHEQLGIEVSIIIIDSKSIPMKDGTIGTPLGISGFNPVVDKRGETDLYGRVYILTQINVADAISGMANLLMGETNERTPFVIVKGMSFEPQIKSLDDIRIPKEECLYFGPFQGS
ncbi:MAG: coenzyme F420-0:L-glutamate ligase [Candidatus Heimdallarchaeota archaeon]|nr:coenzyme F420-0:L-glutamate ligase [Candidatus Heimdallarchaeota archaeon]